MRRMNLQAWPTSAIAIFAVIVIALMTSGAPVLAESLMEKGKGEGLKIAFFNYPPFCYKDASGKIVGTETETVQYVLGKMGLKIASLKATEWGNLIPGLNSGRFDIVAASMYVTPKRCKAVIFSETTFGVKQTLVIKKGNPKNIKNYEDIAERGLTLAVIAGSMQVGRAKDAGIAANKIMEIPDNPTGIAALRSGRADAYGIESTGGKEVVKGVPEQDLELVPPFDTIGGKLAAPHAAIAFRKKDADFVEAFNKVLTKFVGSPEHIALLEKHGMTTDDLPSFTTEQLCKE